MSTVTSEAPARPGWTALPRRRAARPVPALLRPRTPLPRRTRWLLATASIVAPVAAWWAVAASGGVEPAQYLPTPLDTWDALMAMGRSGQLGTDVWATMSRVLAGFGAAIAVSVPLGMLMGTFRSAQSLFEPLIGLLRYLPASAFIPLLLIWLGLGEEPKMTLIFIATVFFNTLMTADVVRQVPLPLIDVSYTLGARVGEVVRKVIIPHSLPGIIDAIRVNAAAAVSYVVVAELVAAETGLGYRIIRFQRFAQVDQIFAVLVVIALIGVTIDITLRITRDVVGRWT
ncbi:ABC transporter permease [Luedemannella helvata]|uniref:ABC transporter permease n=1 Tax=Luedemannella helvata TaxID=349315 RepID=A0ABP4WH58_9ACTN